MAPDKNFFFLYRNSASHGGSGLMGQVMAGAAGLTAGHMVGKVLGGGGGGGPHTPYAGYTNLTIFEL